MKNIIKKFNPFNRKTALVLGGGAARGIAHFGVIDFLIKNEIRFDAIVGTSAGAIYGGLFALHGSIDGAVKRYKEVMEGFQLPDFDGLKYHDETGIKNTIKNMYQSIKKGAWVIKGVIRQSLIDEGMFEKLLDVFFGNNELEKLSVRTYVVATDLKSGKDIIFSKGRLAPIVQGSSSIAGLLPPVKYQGMVLIDGGTTAKLPVLHAIKLGYDKIIAVDVGLTFKEIERFNNVIDVFSRIEKIACNRFHENNLRLADIIIRPQVDDLEWFDFKKTDILFKRGFSKAVEMKSDLTKFNKKLVFREKKVFNLNFDKYCLTL